MKFSDVIIQAVREFWDKIPCNINHSDKELYSKDYFDEVEKKIFC